MKLLVILFLTAIFSYVVYSIFKKNKKVALFLSISIAFLILGLTGVAMARSIHAPDNWCGKFHNTTSYPPEKLVGAMDYFEQGNYDYDRGNCQKAIDDYTKSIKLNSKYPQSFNNRGYTYMRMRDYKNALLDFDQAISLNPNYVNALMNRGDIHNYYFDIDRKSAIADYQKVIMLGGTPNVCGHMFLAEHDGWNLGTILGFPTEAIKCF